MDDGRRAAHQGMSSLARTGLADVHDAEDALAARARLLAAAARHATTLIGAPRLDAWRAGAPPRRSPDARAPSVVAALAWIDALDPADAVTRVQPATTPDAATAAGHWTRSALLVERATDLIATHRQSGGALRVGTPEDLAQGDLGPLLSATTRLVAAVAPTEPLALRCREAGMTRAALDAHLPVGDRLVDETWELARTLRFVDSAVADLTVARPGIDADTPAQEWTQRVARVHARLHRHVAHGRVSVRTLLDVARLGLVTSHVLDTGGRRDHAAQAAITDQWRGILADLDPLHSIEPLDRALRHDVDRMLHLARPSTGATLPTKWPALLAAIEASVPTINACSDLAQQVRSRSTDVWIPAEPRRPYLRDVHAPGHAARRAPPAPAPWPRTPPEPPGRSGLTLD
jgi:hypothetical protein